MNETLHSHFTPTPRTIPLIWQLYMIWNLLYLIVRAIRTCTDKQNHTTCFNGCMCGHLSISLTRWVDPEKTSIRWHWSRPFKCLDWLGYWSRRMCLALYLRSSRKGRKWINTFDSDEREMPEVLPLGIIFFSPFSKPLLAVLWTRPVVTPCLWRYAWLHLYFNPCAYLGAL